MSSLSGGDVSGGGVSGGGVSGGGVSGGVAAARGEGAPEATRTDTAAGGGEPLALDARQLGTLLGSLFIVAACSLLYELLISSLSTYLLGSSVVHYSLTIGLFLFFMGVGAWLAQAVRTHLVFAFVLIELAIGVVGGLSALVLQAVYAWSEFYYPAMVIVIALIGTLVGAEIPLLTRIVESSAGLRRGISQVLTVDYLGALLASLAFPFVLLPYFGHLVAACVTGLVNMLVALAVAWQFRHALGRRRLLAPLALGAAGTLGVAGTIAWAGTLEGVFEQALYEDTVVAVEQSRVQRLVVTRRGDDLRLYLDGSLQFSSLDEYRYHEVLAHLPSAFAARLERALVIGGGDGLAARELLRHDSLRELVVVDLDPAVTRLARTLPALVSLNEGALDDRRTRVVNADAWRWLAESGDLFDVIVIDLPDPESEDTARLYTRAFYERVARRTAVGGAVITQATSPWFARRAYWSIGATLGEAFAHVRPVRVDVPSFGPWGFFVAADHPLDEPRGTVFEGRWFERATLEESLRVPPDLGPLPVEVNRVGSLRLLDYYREGWEALGGGLKAP